MKKLIIIVLFVFSINQYGSAESIEKDWIKMDSIFLNQIKKAYGSNKLSIEKLLKPDKKARRNLGYGYSLIESSMGKGYVSIFYILIYKNGKLVSYKLDPQMPTLSELYERYIRFYKGMFVIKENKPIIL